MKNSVIWERCSVKDDVATSIEKGMLELAHKKWMLVVQRDKFIERTRLTISLKKGRAKV